MYPPLVLRDISKGFAASSHQQVSLYYVKKQEPTGDPRIFREFAVRQSGTTNLAYAKRLAEKVGGFVEEYGKGVVYNPKQRHVWPQESPTESLTSLVV